MKLDKESSKVRLLFEQTGTFKKAFRDAGFNAVDYDIQDTFGETDVIVDLFAEIESAYNGNSDIFDAFSKSDLVFAFFPCTYFTDQSQLNSRGDSAGMAEWTIEQKLDYSVDMAERRERFYKTLCKLCSVAIRNEWQLIIENPYGKCNFLGQYFPIKPGLIHLDRRLFGDKFKKPTQYFFVNCIPSFNLEQEVDMQILRSNPIEKSHGFSRSVIAPEYAKMFVRNYIL